MTATDESAEPMMSLEEYLEAERKRLDRFAEQWREGMRAKAQYFPSHMSEGSWWETYTTFDEGTDMVASAPEVGSG